MLDRNEISKRGYLKEDFRLFHLKDSRAQEVDYHYHAFDKLILLLGGKVTYVVEGVTYFLQPWDMLLVGHDLIHRPIIDPAEPYERVVVWLGREWLERRSDPGEALATASTPPGSGASTCCASTRSGGSTTCSASSRWRRPSGTRASAPPGWRTPSASSC